MEKKSIEDILRSMNLRGYNINKRPEELNIVGIRADTTVPNKFDDTINVFWKDVNGKWNLRSYPATTDAGTYYLKNPINPAGSALVKAGQYINSHKIGTHRTYEALVQQNPITVIRDYNRDAVLDFNNGKEQTGLFGINIHRANQYGTTIDVNDYSAGCQVFANISDFNSFMDLARNHRNKYGNNFTYTLLDERSFNRAIKRRGLYVIVGGLVAVTAYFSYKFIRKGTK
jgi:hypothetical protein